MSKSFFGRPMEILLVEDSQGDAAITMRMLKDGKIRHRLTLVTDGEEVPFGRLRRLGVPAFDLGDHVLDLATTTDRTLDDDVAPEGARSGAGAQSPSGTTHQRTRFQIVR